MPVLSSVTNSHHTVPIRQISANLYVNPYFRIQQVKKYWSTGPNSFTPQELVDMNAYCQAEFNDDQLFEQAKAEKLEKWAKDHPLAAKIHFATLAIHRFSNKNFKWIMGGAAITTLFFYPYISNGMQSQS